MATTTGGVAGEACRSRLVKQAGLRRPAPPPQPVAPSSPLAVKWLDDVIIDFVVISSRSAFVVELPNERLPCECDKHRPVGLPIIFRRFLERI